MRSQFDLPDWLFALVKKARGITNLARICGGIHSKHIYLWKRVPEHHLDSIHRTLGVHPIELRPDLFTPEKLREKTEFSKDGKIKGPRRRKYKYTRRKPLKSEVSMEWLTDQKPVAFTARGRKLVGL